jgi:hypothetical protein
MRSPHVRIVVTGLCVAMLSGACMLASDVAFPVSSADAARMYDIGDGDTVMMLSPNEAAAYLRQLQTPGADCNPIPGTGHGVLRWVAGKLVSVAEKINKVCSAYTYTRTVMNLQVRWALQMAVANGGCFPLVIDTASWRSPKVRVALDGDGHDLFWVQPGQVAYLQNRDGDRTSLPIRCTSYSPTSQTPLPEQVADQLQPSDSPPIEDPYHEDDSELEPQVPSEGEPYQPQFCTLGVCTAIPGS